MLDKQVLKVGVPVESGDVKYICFYVQENGLCPTEEFLGGLLERKTLEELKDSDDSKTSSEQIVAKLLDYLRRWISKGKYPKFPEHYRPVTGTPIWELKAYQGRQLLFYDGKICVITHGFFKRTEKLPAREKRIALQIYDDYQRRKNKLLKGEEK